MAATGVLCVDPLYFYVPDKLILHLPRQRDGSGKKKKNDTKDSIPSKSAYEKLTGRRGCCSQGYV